MCGLYGIFGSPEPARKTYYGLFALQHRGQESAGIAVAERGRGGPAVHTRLGMGLVTEIFPPDELERLRGGAHAIGHVRYSTTGGSVLCNAQPMVVNCSRGEV